jgi:hypothetical protein
MTQEEQMKAQSDEFDAVERLSKCYRNIQMTPIVDDDYPEVRHYYESAIHDLIDKLRANGRIK